MRISKLNQVPFKGRFVIMDGKYDSNNEFIAGNVDVKNMKKDKCTMISGTNVNDDYVRIFVPHKEIPYEKILTLYKASVQCKNADVIIKVGESKRYSLSKDGYVVI